jgi:SAM-dependent methyltransferase
VDTVLCTQVIEHVRDPQSLLRESARVLRVGGHLILSAPLMNVVHEPPYDYFRFTPYGLRLLFENAGFEVVCIRHQGGGWAMLGQNVAWRVGALVPAAGRPAQILSVLLAHAAATPFFMLEHLDKRAAFHESINYLVVGKRRGP